MKQGVLRMARRTPGGSTFARAFGSSVAAVLAIAVSAFVWPTAMQAQVVCATSATCQEYGAAFAPTLTNNVLNESARQSARAAAVNAIMSMPLAIEAPETFGFGLMFNGAFGPEDRAYADDQLLLHEDANLFASGWPVALPVRGGALGSSVYLNLPGDVLGMRREYVLGFHGGFHSVAAKGDTEGNPLDPAAALTRDSYSIRTRNAGVRLGVPLVDPAGGTLLRWNGVQGVIGFTYAHNRSHLETAAESQKYIQTNALGGVNFANLNSADAAIAQNELGNVIALTQTLEYRSIQINESTNFVIPLEVRTGVRLGFISLGFGIGGALNHGRHTIETRYDGQTCAGATACSASNARRDLFAGLIAGSGLPTADQANLLTTIGLVSGRSLPTFNAYSRRKANSDAFLPFVTAGFKLHFYAFDLVLQAMESGSTGGVSFGLETNW
ncbi:MAG: hypothetical protein NXI24_10925 [bacterium]|nr:hypothetical protein [bacterium]